MKKSGRPSGVQPDEYKELLKDIEEILIVKGWSQTRAAEELQVSVGYFNRIFQAQAVISGMMLKRLQRFVDRSS
jgi:plasmid maintenance system antidote protein VapI